ncbi:MAG: NYN domain-containing protein [Chloroflexota bacterium]|jgi:hypothetical protein|nr:NYN domain-containing protein [Chloroflexota bacterium]
MYLIDGHNLIPYIPGIALSDPDDEMKLIQQLQGYCQKRRKSLTVYFDRAPVGQAGVRKFGSVQAVFVREGVTADKAIMDRLAELGKRARNVVVVSSDRQVRQVARAVHAKVISSQAFAAEMRAVFEDEPELDPRNRLLSQEEVAEWEAFFRRGRPDSGHKD